MPLCPRKKLWCSTYFINNPLAPIPQYAVFFGLFTVGPNLNDFGCNGTMSYASILLPMRIALGRQGTGRIQEQRAGATILEVKEIAQS